MFKGSSKDSQELRISVPYSPEIWPSDLYKTRNAPLKWKCVTFGLSLFSSWFCYCAIPSLMFSIVWLLLSGFPGDIYFWLPSSNSDNFRT